MSDGPGFCGSLSPSDGPGFHITSDGLGSLIPYHEWMGGWVCLGSSVAEHLSRDQSVVG